MGGASGGSLLRYVFLSVEWAGQEGCSFAQSYSDALLQPKTQQRVEFNTGMLIMKGRWKEVRASVFTSQHVQPVVPGPHAAKHMSAA